MNEFPKRMKSKLTKSKLGHICKMHWNQWLKVSFNVTLPNGDPRCEGVILPKHHDMFPLVYVNCNVDFKHDGDSSEPVET